MALYWPKVEKKDEANLQPKNAQSWPQDFLALTPSVN